MISNTPETDANLLDIGHPLIKPNTVSADFARKLERERNNQKEIVVQMQAERDEARKSYQTVKDWAHRIEANLNTILDRCCDVADGTCDATAMEKFANELIGLNNSLMLGDSMSLRAERDQLRKVCDALAKQYQHEMTAFFGHANDCECSRCEPMTKLYNQLPHIKNQKK